MRQRRWLSRGTTEDGASSNDGEEIRTSSAGHLCCEPREPGRPRGLLASGDVKVVIDKIYALGEAANAVAHMLGHRAKGKIVLAV
ncbi:zinc-binding dehydrogenase [Arthrobacter terrae]|uniref:zinc-binding dehydrogenase n=1 Tax=Arthrobacter terrae TaxID=2935737 RepID=UPI0035E43C0A